MWIRKLFKFLFVALAAAICISIFAACASNQNTSKPSGGGGGTGYSPSASDAGSPESIYGNGSSGQFRSGQITAATINDTAFNHYISKWNTYIYGNQGTIKGVGNNYQTYGLQTLNPVFVDVVFGAQAVSGATVTATNTGNDAIVYYSAVTNVNGRAILFLPDAAVEAKITAQANAFVSSTVYGGQDNSRLVTLELDGILSRINKLELMFVVDTTGSMGDEMKYISTELRSVIDRIAARNNQIEVSLAVLLYRDKGDEYVTKYYDFTTDITAQQNVLKNAKAKGGGDFPEAVDAALEEAVSKQWSTANTTRLIIHVLDAPPHAVQPDITRYKNAIMKAAELGISIIPVASSGIDETCEYLLRSEALMTGGRYVFITDDSGIGNSHNTPDNERYTVEYLNSLLVRLVSEYITGTPLVPIPYTQDDGATPHLPVPREQ